MTKKYKTSDYKAATVAATLSNYPEMQKFQKSCPHDPRVLFFVEWNIIRENKLPLGVRFICRMTLAHKDLISTKRWRVYQ